MSWGPCREQWPQEWGGEEVVGRVGVQKGRRRVLRKGEIKRNLRMKRKEEENRRGALLELLAPHCGAGGVLRHAPPPPSPPHPSPASGEFGDNLSRKDGTASDTQEAARAREPWEGPRSGGGKVGCPGAQCQEQGWRDKLGSLGVKG